MSFFLGLDLGQSRDFSALAIIEKVRDGKERGFHLRHLQRWNLGTPYPAIVRDVAALLIREPLTSGYPTLAIDGTGVGAAVVDLFRQTPLRAERRNVIITGGEKHQAEGDTWRIPKKELIGAVQVGLQTDRLRIAPKLSEAQTLLTELQNFEVRITDSANAVFGAWREGQHDDLVLATAIAQWFASYNENTPYCIAGELAFYSRGVRSGWHGAEKRPQSASGRDDWGIHKQIIRGLDCPPFFPNLKGD